MRLNSIQLSNVLSFKNHPNIDDAPKLVFDPNLNLIIGVNGSGKSTALEAINFVFKKVLFRQYNLNHEHYATRDDQPPGNRRNILREAFDNSFNGFRLEPNWDSPDNLQTIRLSLTLDDIDKGNLLILERNMERLHDFLSIYTPHGKIEPGAYRGDYTVDVVLTSRDRTFQVQVHEGHDFGINYLIDYNYLREGIYLHNLARPNDKIPELQDSFVLISSYRNYHSFQPSVTLQSATSQQQIQQIRVNQFGKSLNSSDQAEPPIFNEVRLQVADIIYSLIDSARSIQECERLANEQAFLANINARLRVINLRCRISLKDKRNWQFSFVFEDTQRNRVLQDINSLSAGQKAILHLVFEAYGRGGIRGGVVIIDEPEIHLHHQFQNEYLQVVKELNQEQNCQYVLVTHSDALISSETISFVKRFYVDDTNSTGIKAPKLTSEQHTLIQILDNTRSTYAFFSRKVIMVEGETDRYFIKAALTHLYPAIERDIAVLDIRGKDSYPRWRYLFTRFGLEVHFIGDFDNLCKLYKEPGRGIPNAQEVENFRRDHPDWENTIAVMATQRRHFLKHGHLEMYLGTAKSLKDVIVFCNTKLQAFLESQTKEAQDIRDILAAICQPVP